MYVCVYIYIYTHANHGIYADNCRCENSTGSGSTGSTSAASPSDSPGCPVGLFLETYIYIYIYIWWTQQMSSQVCSIFTDFWCIQQLIDAFCVHLSSDPADPHTRSIFISIYATSVCLSLHMYCDLGELDPLTKATSQNWVILRMTGHFVTWPVDYVDTVDC